MGDDWSGVLGVWTDQRTPRDGDPEAKQQAADVTTLSLSVERPTTIEVPATLERLDVKGDAGLLTVNGLTGAFPFTLLLSGKRIAALPRGIPQLERLVVDSDEFDARALAGHSSLREIELDGKHGRLVNAAALASLSQLQALSTRNYYDLDAGAFPPLRSIEYLSLRWLRRDDATRLKKKLAGAGYRRILFTRTDAWIAENGDNPFRDWGDDSPALARGAQKAWRAAKTAERSQPERVLQDLLDELNKLNARHDLETHHREQAWQAFLVLAAELGISARQAKKIFDRREF